jgi:hypothetical protein
VAFSFVLISEVNKARESAIFGILLPHNLSKPRKKEVIVGQLIKDVNKGQTGKRRRSSFDSYSAGTVGSF